MRSGSLRVKLAGHGLPVIANGTGGVANDREGPQNRNADAPRGSWRDAYAKSELLQHLKIASQCMPNRWGVPLTLTPAPILTGTLLGSGFGDHMVAAVKS